MDHYTEQNIKDLARHFGMSTEDVDSVGVTATALLRIRRLENEVQRLRLDLWRLCPDHGAGYEGVHGLGCNCPE